MARGITWVIVLGATVGSCAAITPVHRRSVSDVSDLAQERALGNAPVLGVKQCALRLKLVDNTREMFGLARAWPKDAQYEAICQEARR